VKFVLNLALLLIVSLVMFGCHASADVGHDDDHDASYRKTTVQYPNGDTSVHTEVQHD
jgi:hypothetical protein